MARIPESEIERIKKETDLAALVRSRGVELKQHGSKNLIGCCPFHDDHDPSFVVTSSKGLFHCLGCGAAGNAIQFVEKFDGVSFRHAFELLADGGRAVFEVPSDGPVKAGTIRRLGSPFDPKASDSELMSQVVDYYHERLLQSKDALDYLKQRGIYDEAMIEHFRIGFSDRSLGLRLPNRNRSEGKAIRERLEKLGIYRASGHEHLNGSITVPILDASGNVVEMYGRKIGRQKSKIDHLYLPGPHKGIWNLDALTGPEVILCEAPIDALTFRMNLFHNVTFIYGTQGFTDELFEMLIERKIQSVRLAYDNDEAGNKAAGRDAERLASVGIEVYRIKFPHGMDVNEYTTKVRPGSQSLLLALQSAEWISGTHAPAPSSLAADLVANEKPSPPINSAPESVPMLNRSGDYHILDRGSRQYRVGGLEKNNSLEVLKITLRLRYGEAFHVDSFDLCRDGDRRRFIERAHEETRLEKELIKRDLGKLLFALEDEQQARLSAALSTESQPVAELTSEERTEALAFLKSPKLTDRIADAFDECGLVGEGVNRLAAYLACTSRKLARPLAVIIQSTSAAGKSTLMDAVLAMFPNEEQIKYSAMTGQSLYYLGETNLKHRILAIVEEEGAEKASYALKLLQSEGELTIASTGKDPHTGRMETQEYHVEGPVMIFLTTTAIDIDEELQNRCLTLSVDESREQTERIHALQRQARTLDGLRLRRRRTKMLALMQNVQRLLEPVDIVNPFADRLTFTAGQTRTRRDHEKYLTLIDAIALLHQHQRPKETDEEGGTFIQVTLEDIELANQLAPELLGRSLDELPPQTRRLLECIKTLVRTRCEKEKMDQSSALFSRRELCEQSGWSYSQVKRHLVRLQELEHIAARFGRMGTTMRYELLVDVDEPDTIDQIGLLDVEKLKPTTRTRTGKKATLTPLCQKPKAKLKRSKGSSNANLATLPKRTSGTAVLTES